MSAPLCQAPVPELPQLLLGLLFVPSWQFHWLGR